MMGIALWHNQKFIVNDTCQHVSLYYNVNLSKYRQDLTYQHSWKHTYFVNQKTYSNKRRGDVQVSLIHFRSFPQSNNVREMTIENVSFTSICSRLYFFLTFFSLPGFSPIANMLSKKTFHLKRFLWKSIKNWKRKSSQLVIWRKD